MLYCLREETKIAQTATATSRKKRRTSAKTKRTYIILICCLAVCILRWLLCQQFPVEPLLAGTEWTRKHIHTYSYARTHYHTSDTIKTLELCATFFFTSSPIDIYVEHLYFVFSFHKKIKWERNLCERALTWHAGETNLKRLKIEDVNVTQLLIVRRFHRFTLLYIAI